MTDDDREINKLIRMFAVATNGAAGLIVALVDDVSDKPIAWWSGAMPHDFGEPEMESPLIFVTVGGARRCAKRLNADDLFCRENATWRPVLWTHPDIEQVPDEKYMSMTGIKFIGSPRR